MIVANLFAALLLITPITTTADSTVDESGRVIPGPQELTADEVEKQHTDEQALIEKLEELVKAHPELLEEASSSETGDEEVARWKDKPQYKTSYKVIGCGTPNDETGKYGYQILLNDDSQWSTILPHGACAEKWSTSDLISITRNRKPGAKYHFLFVNENRKQEVEVEMVKGPKLQGNDSHWVYDVDKLNGIVTLQNGAKFDISWWDKAALKQWERGDHVFIGLNDPKDFFCESKPNILLNVEKGRAAMVRGLFVGITN